MSVFFVDKVFRKLSWASLGVIINALNDEDYTVRDIAASFLSERKDDPESFFPLCDALKNSSRQVKIIAIGALIKLNDSRAIEPLFECLNDTDIEIRLAIIHAYKYLRNTKTRGKLIELLNNENHRIRYHALASLSYYLDPPPVDEIIEALRDPHHSVRRLAAQVLGKYKDKKALIPLKNIEKNDIFFIARKRAKEAILKIEENKSLR